MLRALVVLITAGTLLTGCATTPMDHRVAEIERAIAGMNSEDGFIDDNGLTLAGFEYFFGTSTLLSLDDWRKLTPGEKEDLLAKRGGLVARSLWVIQRNADIAAGIRAENPKVSAFEISQAIDNLGSEAVANCIESRTLVDDFCILILANIASRKEMNEASIQIAEYTKAMSDRRRMSQFNPLIHRSMMPPPARPMPKLPNSLRNRPQR